MIYPEVYSDAFAELKAQEFAIQRTTLDARIENSKEKVSEWEQETAQKLLDMYSAGLTKYRHIVFDSAESVYAWNGSGFIPVDIVQDKLFFHDDWSEYAFSTSEEIRSACDLFYWQLEQFIQRLRPKDRPLSMWVIGTFDTLPFEEAVDLAIAKSHEIKNGLGLMPLSLEDYRKLPHDDVRTHLSRRGEFSCWNILQHAKIKVAQAI